MATTAESSSSKLYAERSEWADVKPVAQHDTLVPVAPIFYTDDYKDATSYFRGIVQSQEYSDRVLELTLHIIRLNPAHYSVWQYRWATLMALKSPLQQEQTLMEGIATKHLKTYQVWHHRRLLLLQLKNPIPELLFLTNILQEDAKNYHTWAYRQWILAQFGKDLKEDLWNSEVDFVEEMIDEDVRNNSAWHHRFFIIWSCGVRPEEGDKNSVLRRELRYVKTKISLAPTNLSAWNYLRGILNHTKTPYSKLIPFVTPYTAATFVGQTSSEIDLDDPRPGQGAELPCNYALEFLADTLAKDSIGTGKAIELYRTLAEVHDPTRRKYWNYRISELNQLDHLQSEEGTV